MLKMCVCVTMLKFELSARSQPLLFDSNWTNFQDGPRKECSWLYSENYVRKMYTTIRGSTKLDGNQFSLIHVKILAEKSTRKYTFLLKCNE